MVLTLEVIGPEAPQLGAGSRKTFRASGGTIGRLPSNDWSLPDQIVSNRHAVIAYRDSAFSIEDRSTNGTYLNAPNNRLPKGVPHPLQTGDRIFIPPYEITAAIAPDAAAGDSPAAPFSFDDLFGDPDAGSPAPLRADADPFGRLQDPGPDAPAPFLPGELVSSDEQVDPLRLLGFESRPAPTPREESLARGSALSDPYKAPAIVPPTGESRDDDALIPDDWFNDPPSGVSRPASSAPGSRRAPEEATPSRAPREARDPARPRVPARPAPGQPAVRAGGGSLDLAEVLAGAGLEGVPVTPELARNFGQILRVVVAGVMGLLQARQKIKNEFRLGVTSIKPADNNPLKFSANVDDALHNLLVKRNAAFLGPIDAFDDAFVDIGNHQIAMLQAVRVAFDAMLAEFDPDHLQTMFDQRNKGALLAAPAKMRYWDQYRDRIRDMVRDPDASFRELFGDEFAMAYEQQLQRLRSLRRQP